LIVNKMVKEIVKNVLMKQELGLYYPDGSFQSDSEIVKRLELEQIGFKRIQGRDIKPDTYWIDRFKQRHEVVGQSQQELKFQFNESPTINFLSDLHIGSPETDYDRIDKEVSGVITTPNNYVVFLGDMIDAFTWNPGQMEDMEQVPEQIGLVRELIDNLTSANKLLGIIPGNHEDWQRRSGVNIYELLTDKTDVPVQYGVNYLTAFVGNQEYKMTIAHCLPGFSMYNNTHPQMREDHFGAEGADIIIGGHTHKKGMSIQYKKEHGGRSRPVYYLSLGSYKETDGFQAKNGRHKLDYQEMGGMAVKLEKDVKKIEVKEIENAT
jgi:UDP-2,3-diacylglucosamine pyrophosphatase LpxH